MSELELHSLGIYINTWDVIYPLSVSCTFSFATACLLSTYVRLSGAFPVGYHVGTASSSPSQLAGKKFQKQSLHEPFIMHGHAKVVSKYQTHSPERCFLRTGLVLYVPDSDFLIPLQNQDLKYTSNKSISTYRLGF